MGTYYQGSSRLHLPDATKQRAITTQKLADRRHGEIGLAQLANRGFLRLHLLVGHLPRPALVRRWVAMHHARRLTATTETRGLVIDETFEPGLQRTELSLAVFCCFCDRGLMGYVKACRTRAKMRSCCNMSQASRQHGLATSSVLSPCRLTLAMVGGPPNQLQLTVIRKAQFCCQQGAI